MTPEPADERRAADVLGVPPDAPAAARAAFLRRLPRAGFVPPPHWLDAVRTLTGRPAPEEAVAPTPDPARLDGLRAEVEGFAGQFWALPPGERRRRWQNLIARCAIDPPLAARLRRLEAGMDLPAGGEVAVGRSGQLAEAVRRLFVLRPAERAAARRRYLNGRWEAAARELLACRPALAALEPDLIDRLAHWTENRRQRTLIRQLGRRTVPAFRAARVRGSAPFVGTLIGVVLAIVWIIAGGAGRNDEPPRPRGERLPPAARSADDASASELPESGGDLIEAQRQTLPQTKPVLPFDPRLPTVPGRKRSVPPVPPPPGSAPSSAGGAVP